MFYKKRPVVIEAVRICEGPYYGFEAPVVEWLLEALKDGRVIINGGKEPWDGSWQIRTLEDGPNGEAKHIATPGDYIIKGVEGELYFCKPGIFHKTYERVE